MSAPRSTPELVIGFCMYTCAYMHRSYGERTHINILLLAGESIRFLFVQVHDTDNHNISVIIYDIKINLRGLTCRKPHTERSQVAQNNPA